MTSRKKQLRSSFIRDATLGFVLTGILCVLFAVTAAASPSAGNPGPGVARQARVLESDRTGVASPAGLAFSSASNSFYVIGAGPGGSSTDTEIVRLTPFDLSAASDRAGSARIAAAIKDPVNVAFDARANRLLLLDAADRLLEVRAGANGDLDATSLVRRDALRLDLRDAQGIAVDPASGVVFILDAGVPAIVRVEPAADGSFDAAATSVIDLGPSSVSGARGLALDPTTGHLHLRSTQGLVELTTEGSSVTTRDLSELGLGKAEGMAFAPSGDSTDDPAELSVYVADSGGARSSGQVVEVSLTALAAEAASFTSTLVRTVDLATLPPRSPDPSGITYLSASDRLVISDGEVEEVVNGITHFQGVNVWELSRTGAVQRTANISKVPPTVVPMTNEPTGVAYNPTNGHYYFTDDDARRVFDLNPGADGLVGTAGDTWTSFSTVANGNDNGDPEGITYNTFNGRLYVADGVNREVYEYSTSGTLLSHFDVLTYGVNDPEGVEFNPVSGTLFTLSQASLIVETTIGGSLLGTIDASASGGLKHAGVAYAPASSGVVGAKSFYVVDRGIDNNVDPNIVDGKLFELSAPAPSAPANLPPVVSAGPDLNIASPASAALDGTVTDDGKPTPPSLTTTWTQVSGPSTITFANASAIDTTASVSVPGIYGVRLTASDGQYTAFDEATLTFTGSGSVDVVDIRVNGNSDDAEEVAGTGQVQRGDSDLDMMTDNSDTKLAVGLRFNGVTVPQGANVTNAYLQFTADEAHSDPTSLTIKGQAADNALTFSTTAFDVSSRPKTTASAAWSPNPWLGVGDAGLAQRSSNLTGVIQEIVGRSGWASGNSLVLVVTGSGRRVAVAHNQTPAAAPLLHVEWTTGGGNATPVITSDGGGNSASVSPAENQVFATDVDAVDADAGDTLTYSISGGPDAARFAINSSTGVLTFLTAPNFEAPNDAGANNVYDVIVSVSDGRGGSDSQAIAAAVQNVNEFAPVITSNGGGATAGTSRPENQTAVTTVTATDADGDALTYALSGGPDQAAFTIDPASGVLTFVNAPDFEAPTDVGANNVYDVIVEASDGSLSDTQALAVTVTDVVEGSNQAPSVNAGPDQVLILPAGATLDGTVSDDGLPNPPAAVTTTWTKTSGPGTVIFGNASLVDTSATFSQSGVYVLRLTASDSLLSTFDELTVTATTGAQSLDIQVSVGADDAEQRTDNTVALGNADLDMMTADELNLVVGTRFRGVTVPQGANITNAYLQFTADEVHSVTTSLTIKGQADDNAAVFTTATGNLSSRPTTTASSSWTVAPWLNVNDAGLAQRTPSLAGVIQEIVSRSGWASGNSLVLLVTGTGTRVARSYNIAGGALAPVLHVEWTTGGNQAPVVNAGPDQTITLPASASLDGTVSDDGLPAPPALTSIWSKTSGPGAVTFGDALAVDTSATFSQSGTYVLRLTATDGERGSFDELTVTVNPASSNQAPFVNAGPDQTITLPASASLDGTVSDDGLPAPPALTSIWSKTSGPGAVTFGDALAVDTSATFSQSGTYVLRLTATDGERGSFDELTVTVNPASAGSSSLYFSLFNTATVGLITAADEDVIFFDGTNFSLAFDGSDVGIEGLRIDAFSWIDATRTSLLLSFDAPGAVTGIAGTVDDSDIVLFTVTSFGANTAGTFSLYFDGSLVGLTTNAEDVDAVELLPNGHILLSTVGAFGVTGVSGDDKDLLEFVPVAGPSTAGTFSLYFDGSDVDLTTSGEDINAVAVDAIGKIYLSTLNNFAVTGVSGADEDVFVFTPTSLGSATAGTYSPTLYFDGSAFGLAANEIFAIDLP